MRTTVRRIILHLLKIRGSELDYLLSLFYYILYEIIVEINKRHGIQICAFDYST